MSQVGNDVVLLCYFNPAVSWLQSDVRLRLFYLCMYVCVFVCVCVCVPILCGLIIIHVKASLSAIQFLYMTLANDKINEYDLSNIVIMNTCQEGTSH